MTKRRELGRTAGVIAVCGIVIPVAWFTWQEAVPTTPKLPQMLRPAVMRRRTPPKSASGHRFLVRCYSAA
jgi:hypothetical protein